MSEPPDPVGDQPRRLLGLGFWAIMACALLSVLAGVAVAELGPKLWPGKAAPAPVTQPTPTSLGERAKSR